MGLASDLVLSIVGIDKTASTFGSVDKKAKDLSSRLKKTLTFAALGAGAFGFVRSFKSAMNSMNEMADTAMRSGLNGEWLQKFSGAMSQAGVQVGVNDITGAIAKMNATLANPVKDEAFEKLGFNIKQFKGLKPETAFTEMLTAISKVGSEQERVFLLQRTLGNSGAAMAPLLRQGPEAFSESLDKVMAMIPAVSDESLNVATSVNNAFSLLSDEMTASWYEWVGSALSTLEDWFGPLEENIAKIPIIFRRSIDKAVTVVGWGLINMGRGVGDFVENTKRWLGGFVKNWREVFSSIWDYTKEMVKAIGQMFKGLGKAIWSAIKGDGFDFSELQAGLDRFKKNAFKPVDFKIEYQKSDMLDIGAELDRINAEAAKAIQIKVDGVRAKKTLAASLEGAVDPLGEKLKGKVSKGVKEGLASAVESTSYESFKAIFAAGGSIGGSSASAAGAQSAKTERLATEGNRTLSSILAELKEQTRLLRNVATI